MARFVLAHPDPMSKPVQHAKSLAVAPDNPAAELVRAQSHPDLLVLERTIGDNGKLRTVIRVDDARQVTVFLGTTAGLGGWRVVIVDAVDDLNAESANALLKGLEEPPSRTLVSAGQSCAGLGARHHPLALPSADCCVRWRKPRWRRRWRQRPGRCRTTAVLAASEGSVSRALSLSEGPAFKLRQQAMALLARLPHDRSARTACACRRHCAAATRGIFEIVLDAINDWMSARLRLLEDKAAPPTSPNLERVNAAARAPISTISIASR